MPDELVINIQRPNLTGYQKDILYCDARFTVVKGATKIGKTFPHLWWLFERAHERKKPGANYWWVAPIFQQAKIAFNRMRRVAVQAGYRINESELFIELPFPYDARIWFKSADKPDSLYGEDVFAAVFDEFTRAKEAAWHALRSTLTHTKGPCKFIGNAKGKKNWGHKLWVKAKAGEPGYRAFKVTAYDAVEAGILDAEEIEQARRDLPEQAFKELYEAEDLDDQANPFGMDHIKQCLKPMSDLAPVCFGIDLAKSIDWTVVTGLDMNGDVCSFERWQSDWGQTRRRIVAIVGGLPAFADCTGVGDPIVEDIMKECYQVEGYTFTSPSKQKLMEGLSSAIQSHEIGILDGIMRDELESFEYEYVARGVRYSAPEGSHDDIVCSLALARAKWIDRPRPTSLSFHK